MEKLKEIRDLKDYSAIIETLLLSYVKTQEFADCSERERADIVDSCQELKSALNNYKQ